MRLNPGKWLFPWQLFVMLSVLLFGLGGAHAQVASTAPHPLQAATSDLRPEQQGEALRFLSAYKLGPGDVITVRVFGEDDLSREKIRLTDSGSVFMPAVGELVILNKTLGEVERLVADALRGRILVNPQVSVFVEEYRPFFINGMVERPGGYPYQPALTVRKAAAVAGGFKERASLSKIFVIRGDDRTHTANQADLDALVFPGDTITVGESFF